MAGITLNTTFAPGANLPMAAPLSEQLIALPSLVAWFEAEAGYVTLSGSEILTMPSRKGAGVLTAGGAGTRAVLTPGQFGAFSGALFNGGEADRYDLSGLTFAQTSAFSLAWIGKLSSVSGNQVLIGRFSSSTARAAIFTSGAGIRFGYGTTQVSGENIAAGSPFLAIASYDGANLKLSVNGVRGADVAAAGSPSTVSFALGAAANGTLPMSGALADAFLFTGDVHANEATLQLIKKWAQELYGVVTV